MPSKFPRLSRRRKQNLLKLYNLTEDDYNNLLEAQQFRCKICGKPWTFGTLHVDHDHKTGKVRGLLCGLCNSMLGFADDNPDILLKALQYIRTSKAKRREEN